MLPAKVATLAGIQPHLLENWEAIPCLPAAELHVRVGLPQVRSGKIALKPRACLGFLPSSNSSMIFAQKAGRSSRLRLLTSSYRPRPHCRPIFRQRSRCLCGRSGTRLPPLNANGKSAEQSVNHLNFHFSPRFADDGLSACQRSPQQKPTWTSYPNCYMAP